MAGKKEAKKGKKPHKNKPTSKKYSKYKIEGIFLMDTKDRLYCGKCHYSEFKKK
jgi:ribosomal protein S27AE